ncbi:MAG TPA: thioredoxin domain-containing protein [Ktedonosporobacter sp.]|nr:thioredoxin domain-containing protein [Ktedonosporobacter sp.]
MMHTNEVLNGNLFEVSDQDFEARILKSSLPTIVNFGAMSWCPACRALAPVYQRLSAEYQGKLGFAKMDIDENLLYPARFGIQAAPTLVFFKDGQEIERIIGPHPSRLKLMIDRIVAGHSIA